MSFKKPLNKKFLGKVTIDPELGKNKDKMICPEKFEKAKQAFENPSFHKLIKELKEKEQ